jgi:carboxypeptidase T
MTTFITMHNVAALVLRPPGVSRDGQAPDEAQLKALGDAMGKATGYTSQYGYQLYDTSGTTEDWNYGSAGTFGYTIEMGPTNGEFHSNYKLGVIDQYDGSGRRKGLGLREAFLLAAENSFLKKDHAVLTGRAPAGRTLRVKKTFQTATGQICTVANSIVGRTGGADVGCLLPGDAMQIDDFVEYTMTVPRSGKFTWIMPPSTRPFVSKEGKTEAYQLTCERAGVVKQSKAVTVMRGKAAKLTLKCGGKLPRAKKKR